MSATWSEHQPRRDRGQLDRALVLSLCIHVLVLSLQIGVLGFGLPGLLSPLADDGAQNLTVKLAEVPPVAAPVALPKPRDSSVVVPPPPRKRPPPRKPPPVPRKPPALARKVPPKPPQEQPQKKEIAPSEPRDTSELPPPPAPPWEQMQKKPIARSVPRDTSVVAPPSAPQEEEPPKNVIALSEARDTSFVVRPPAPQQEEREKIAPSEAPETFVAPPTVPPEEVPQAKEAIAEEAPKSDAAPEEVAKTLEEAATQEELMPQEEALEQADAGELEQPIAEGQAREQEAGPRAGEAARGQARDESRGLEGAPRLALDLGALRPAEERARVQEEERKQEESREARKREQAPPEQEVGAEPDEARELPPVTDAILTMVPAVKLPCEDAETNFLAGQELERGGDLKGSFRAFKESAQCGYGLAQRKLGDWYLSGNAVVFRDYETSLRWYRRAREQGIKIPNVPTQYRLQLR